MKKLYIFDKDGTLIEYNTKKNRPANTPEEQILLPGVLEKISALKKAGHKIAIASNQGGVAWGYISLAQAEILMQDVARKIGADAWTFSPYDPKAKNCEYSRDDESRKPRPGMIFTLMRKLNFSPSQTVVVGDQESDRQAAVAAGCSFVWANDFFYKGEKNV